MMEENVIHNRDFLENGLPDRCASLIIADPPYFRVKGEFDKQWDTFDEYLKDVERWGDECARVIKSNGSMFWFGFHKTIAYIQIILDKKFRLLNNMVLCKSNGKPKVLAKIAAQRSFLPNDERVLFYEANVSDKEGNGALKARNKFAFEQGMCHTRCVKPVIDYLNGERERAGFTVPEICKAFEMSMPSHWFTYKSQFVFPTRENYGRLRELFNSCGEFLRKEYEFLRKEYEELRKEYEELRKEYEELRRPFKLTDRQSDIWKIKVDSGLSNCYGHPTVKNYDMIREMILITTRPGDLVVDPFSGSGTVCAAAKSLGRRFVGFEINPEYAATANRRRAATQPPLF